MTVRDTLSIVMLASGSVMTVVYSAVLLHIYHGKKRKWLTIVVSLLLISQISLIVFGYGYMKVNAQYDYSYLNEWLNGGGLGLYYSTFNTAHYLLAEKYRDISKRVPAQLNGKPEPQTTQTEKVVYWLLLCLNVVCGLAYGVAVAIVQSLRDIVIEKPGLFLTVFKLVVTYATRLCAIISGVILIVGVHRIRKFFKERNATDYINTAMLLRHGFAFGLYLVCSTASAVMLLFVNLNPLNPAYFSLFCCVFIADLIGQLISELFLCEIFWHLGTDTTKQSAQSEPGQESEQDEEILCEPVEVETEEFDEDAELQAKIWNSLVRSKSKDDRFSFHV
jgi:drug/metabolite transporter (DMT)-like permease